MAMESVMLNECNAVPGSGESYSTDEPLHFGTNGVQENEHVGDFLNDFDSYFEDIKDHLIVSRVVSDSVIKGIVNAVSEEAAEMVSQVIGLKEQLLEGQMVQQLQEEIGVVVIQNAIHNLKEEYDKRLMGSQFDGNKMVCCRDNLMQVSSICKDLEAVQKSLSNIEQLCTHRSVEAEYFHRRLSNNNAFPSSSLSEGNGGNEESNVNLPKDFDSSSLKRLSTDELYSHFRDMIKKIKRDHEATVQVMTEEFFSLKREFLNEKGSFLPHKNKDFDVLRKRMPDVISKLNDIALKNEDFSEMCDLSRAQYNSLLMENRHLRDMLDDKEREVNCLPSQVSEAEQKMPQKSSAEAYFSKQIEDLRTSLDDEQIKASLSEEVYKCIIRDLAHQTKFQEEENNMKSIMMQETLELIFREALYAEAEMSLECGDFSNIQTTTAQEISGVIYQEALKDMEIQLNDLKEKYLEQDKLFVSLESKASDMEKTLSLKDEEKHNLEQNILELETLVEEDKAKLLITEKEHFHRELNEMMDRMAQQEAIKLEELKVKLEQSLQQVDLYKDQVHKLTQILEKAKLEIRTAILQERKNASLLIDMKDREYKGQIKSVVHVVQGLTKTFADFELKAALSIKSNEVRLGDSTSELKSLVKIANLLRRTGLLCKEKLERRCSDLKKAEAEVDLLGDEVETLLGLLEKIYIALDHYSPILQHYPGIMEILKLVQRALNGESAKSGSRTP